LAEDPIPTLPLEGKGLKLDSKLLSLRRGVGER
jgi:hypothetical protein